MLLEMAADGMGDRIAYGSVRDGWTYDDLRRCATAVAAHVAEHNANTVALVEPSSPLIPVALFGAAWSGASYAPLNYRLPEATRQELLRGLRPAALAESGWLDLPPSAGLSYPEAPNRPAVLLYTSGTTAPPKAAVLEHDQLLAYQLNTVEFGSANEDEATLLAVPPFHIAGVTAILSSTYAGRRVVALPRFDADEWLRLAREEAVTHAFVVPTMLARIVAALEMDPAARPLTLRHLAYGGARMPAPVVERALEQFGEVDFVNAYGLTETSSTVCILAPDDHRAARDGDVVAKTRLASVGRPVPGIEVRVVNEAGTEVGPGVSGEIQVRGAQVSGDYVDAAIRRHGDGWLPTGDRGRVDDHGYVFVEGRGDDTIIRGGENIAAAEVEDAFLRHPGVDCAAVVGLPDDEWGERLAAMVSLRPGANAGHDELRAWVRDRLGSLKAPDLVVVCDEVPQTATGKVLRRQVRADLTAVEW